MTKLIFGCGYLGKRVVRIWRDASDEVTVVTRSQQKAFEFQRQGFMTVVADINDEATLSSLPGAETILFAVGFDRTPGHSIINVYQDGFRNVLRSLSKNACRVIYVSTTGVYDDAAGGWIDENTPTNPRRDGGRASLAAEQVLSAHALGANSVILRLAGIYGPGRVPFLDLLQTGQPIPAVEDGHLNLIHVDDAAAAVVAAAQLERFSDGPRTYCISDGHPVQRGDYYREVARQIGAPPVQFVAPDPKSPRAARAEADRRICNDRMLADLRVPLKFPDYLAGLAAILSASSRKA